MKLNDLIAVVGVFVMFLGFIIVLTNAINAANTQETARFATCIEAGGSWEDGDCKVR